MRVMPCLPRPLFESRAPYFSCHSGQSGDIIPYSNMEAAISPGASVYNLHQAELRSLSDPLSMRIQRQELAA